MPERLNSYTIGRGSAVVGIDDADAQSVQVVVPTLDSSVTFFMADKFLARLQWEQLTDMDKLMVEEAIKLLTGGNAYE